ncbi:MAG: amidase family protein [bacterium]|nr:amidase family protein [bacterium]
MAANDRIDEDTKRPSLSRRGFLGAVGVAGLTLTGCGTTGATAPRVPENDLLDGDALDQAARIRSGQATAEEMVQATIDRIEALNGPINAVVTTFYERALARAAGPLPEGPFRGVPFLLKDLNDLEGTPKSMGSRLFEGFVSTESSPHTEAVLEAGFVVLGKTNTPEFGLTATTEPAALGVCRNPWNLAHSAGGSSGGAAAAVAARMLPMAQASDGGGSIRVPASCNGIFGLKPSRGRNRAAPQTRAVDISVKHSVSRSVRDTAAYTTVVQRTDPAAPFAPLSFVEGPSDQRLEIGFFTKNAYGVEAHPEVKRCLEETAALCDELGHEVVPTTIDFEGDRFLEHFLDLWCSIPAGILEQVRAQGLDPEAVLEPVTLGMAERFARAGDGAMTRAVDFFEGYGGRIDAQRAEFDVLLSPVLRRPPLRIGEQAGTQPFDEVFEPLVDYVSYTPIWNATGHPGMSVPLGWTTDGLPIGSQFVAGHGEEGRLLALAYELEAARPWADRRPA